MNKETQKLLLFFIEAIYIIILFCTLFFLFAIFLRDFIETNAPYWFTEPKGLFLILGFDIAWLVGMKLWPLKTIRVKIYLSVVVFSLSSYILVLWFVYHALENALH